ncbi:MAG: acetyl-CoA carboxylase carboxyltransferase subunit alpha [Candidatus Methylomirabilales bacterium]
MAQAHYALDFEKPLVELETKIKELKRFSEAENVDFADEVKKLEHKLQKMQSEILEKLTPWQRCQIARHPDRPYTLDYIRLMMTDFMEIHGDRVFADDTAIVAGLGRLQGMPLVVVGHQKGRDTKEKIARNFAMAHPEGYRKALRAMKLAEKFGKPVLALVDTPGAYPGIGAEERGQAEAIAKNLRELADLRVPVVVVITGEGGSGGALALGVGDRVLMLEYAIYSVISPEGCASILWRDPAKAPQAAEALGLTAPILKSLGLVDEIIPEPAGGSHRDPESMAATLQEHLVREFQTLKKIRGDQLLELRYQKFRRMGVLEEG